jgi:hypothetical protein
LANISGDETSYTIIHVPRKGDSRGPESNSTPSVPPNSPQRAAPNARRSSISGRFEIGVTTTTTTTNERRQEYLAPRSHNPHHIVELDWERRTHVSSGSDTSHRPRVVELERTPSNSPPPRTHLRSRSRSPARSPTHRTMVISRHAPQISVASVAGSARPVSQASRNSEPRGRSVERILEQVQERSHEISRSRSRSREGLRLPSAQGYTYEEYVNEHQKVSSPRSQASPPYPISDEEGHEEDDEEEEEKHVHWGSSGSVKSLGRGSTKSWGQGLEW